MVEVFFLFLLFLFLRLLLLWLAQPDEYASQQYDESYYTHADFLRFVSFPFTEKDSDNHTNNDLPRWESIARERPCRIVEIDIQV